MQHRQVEAAAVPGHEIGRVALDAVEEALQKLGLLRLGLPEAPHTQAIAAAKRAGDGNHSMLFVGQEVAAGGLALQGEHRLGDLFVRQTAEIVNPASELHVGHGLDIEDQYVHARDASISVRMSRTATARPSNIARATIA